MTFEAQPISKEEITFSEYNESGCPVCKTGEKDGFTLARTGAGSLFACAHCGVAYFVFNDESEDQQ